MKLDTRDECCPCAMTLNIKLAFKPNKTEVTSVKLVLCKYVMSFDTLTKVDQLTEILRFG